MRGGESMELFTGDGGVLEGDKLPGDVAYLGLFFNGVSLTTAPPPHPTYSRGGVGGEWIEDMGIELNVGMKCIIFRNSIGRVKLMHGSDASAVRMYVQGQ